jgi:hypothetical protein
VKTVSKHCEPRIREHSTRSEAPADCEMFQPDLSTAEEWMELGIRVMATMLDDNPAADSPLVKAACRQLAAMIRMHARSTVKAAMTTHAVNLRDAYLELKAAKE